jgi:hypothetical protein
MCNGVAESTKSLVWNGGCDGDLSNRKHQAHQTNELTDTRAGKGSIAQSRKGGVGRKRSVEDCWPPKRLGATHYRGQ